MAAIINTSELQNMGEAMGLSCFILEPDTLRITNSLMAYSVFPEVITVNEAAYLTDLIEAHCTPQDIGLVKNELLLFKSGRKDSWAGIFRINKADEQNVWVYMKMYRGEKTVFQQFNYGYCIITELDQCGIAKEQLNVFIAELKKMTNAERIKKLTRREIEVVRLISKGYSYTGIAVVLNIRPDTVNCHRKNILRKLEINNIAMISCFASEVGLI